MRRVVPVLIAILVAAVSWIFFNNFTIRGLDKIAVVPKSGETPAALDKLGQHVAQLVDSAAPSRDESSQRSEVRDQAPRLRLATFNIQAFNQTKARKPHVLDILARIMRQFDVVAVQEVQSDADDLLPRLVQQMNVAQPVYDYAIGPRVGPEGAREQYGFVFNRQAVVLDRKELYTVDDRDDVFSFEPLVGWFRAVGPPAAEAFTFTVINLRIDPLLGEQERLYLDDLVFAVRDDGRQEDDIIIAGDLQAGAGELGEIERLQDLGLAVSHVPTDVEGTSSWDNLIFQKTPTAEYTGNSGVWDFLRRFNLNLNEALEVSNHLPVWAEFTIREGGEAGRIAADNAPDRR